MNRCVLGLAGLIGVALAAPGMAYGQLLSAPKITLSQESWDFGAVWHPDPQSLTLIVKNEGNAELKLTNVKTTCGCTLVQPGRKEIPAGESTDVKVRFDTIGKQDQVHSSVIIDSNDPLRPHIEFKISGFVKRAVRRTPLGGLVIKTLDPNPGQTGTVRLENQTEQPLQLKFVSCTLPGLEIEIKEVKPGQVYDVIGKTTQVMHHGVTRGDVIFDTGLEREAKLSVGTMVQVMALVDPIPPGVLLEPSFAPKAASRAMSFNYYGTKEDFRVTGVTCAQAPDLKATIGPPLAPSGGMETLVPKIKYIVKSDVPLPAARDLPPGGWHLVYTTNDPAYPTVEILVTSDRKAWEDVMYGPHGEPAKKTP